MSAWLRRLWARVKRMHLKFTATRGMAYSIAFLFLLGLAIAAVNLLFTAHYVQQAQQQQRQQGAVVERKICTTLGRIASLEPPAGSPAANPSRAYEQRLHTTLAQLGPDLGCGKGTP